MATTGTYQGHAYAVTYATENDWPVTSLRITLRRPLPPGVAVHPRDAAPWSSGKISARIATVGDAEFDKGFAVRAERAADVRFLGPELRRALLAALDEHPGLWLGHNGLVCVERGHVRDTARIQALLEELVVLATVVAAAVESGGRPGRETAVPAAQSAAALSAAAQPTAASGEPGDLAAFVAACFDRRVAAYEVNRRLQREWIGRRVHGTGVVVRRMALGGHDFDFAGLKGWRVELHVKGPEDVTPLVRLALQVEEAHRAEVERLEVGQTVRFDGRLLDANPLLSTVQLDAAVLKPAGSS